MNRPEALRLADELEKDRWHITGVTAHEASEELRRLYDLLGKANALCRIRHAIIQTREDECLTHSAAFYEATRLLSEAREQRDALLESMRWIAEVNATDYEYQAKARAAIAKAEEA